MIRKITLGVFGLALYKLIDIITRNPYKGGEGGGGGGGGSG